MEVCYSEDKKYAYFDGYKFTRDDRTGYYLYSTERIRLHRYVWTYYNGLIPKGYHIHHIDADKGNNDISNLVMMLGQDHIKEHAQNLTEEQKQKLRDNMNRMARPAACIWHKSKEGLKWHKRHYEEMKDRLHRKDTFKCLECGEEFIATANGQTKFCSNACKSKYRRKSGVDNEKRICECCGREFEANKYTGGKTCSKDCAYRLRYGKGKDDTMFRPA